MKLPDNFLETMKETLKDDYDSYLEYLDKTPFRGLRVNSLKVDVDFIRKNIGFDTKPTPFCKEGFYIDNELKGVGNHPYHHCGAIYLQEPSAMSAVTALDVQKGDKVLDLCAAPGGKSTQIAAELDGTGLLWSNEYVASRAKILCSNLERCGVKNAVVSNADTKDISDNLKGFFDKVLVDAPCSGEGMIRREPNAILEWKIENRKMCADRQIEILQNAAKCLKNDGILVYSTCTLSLEENELTVEKFLKLHPEFELVDINAKFGHNGYTYFTDNKDLQKTRRILFVDGGEGHFVAKFKKHSFEECNVTDFKIKLKENKVFNEFYLNNFNDSAENIYENNNKIYLLPNFYPQTTKIKILKAGVRAGEIVKNRFVPSHELYMSKKITDIKSVENLSCDDNRINEFLHGLEIDCDKKGYTAVAVDNMITGFGKASNGKLKNHYPKGLRILK